MEQAEHVEITVNEKGRAWSTNELLSWMMLSASAIFSIVAAVVTTLPPLSWFIDPIFETAYSIMGALGITWVGFSVITLILTLIPYRRGEGWAWYTLWMLPLLWLSLFMLSPDLLLYLVLAIFTAIGLVLPYQEFFRGSEKG